MHKSGFFNEECGMRNSSAMRRMMFALRANDVGSANDVANANDVCAMRKLRWRNKVSHCKDFSASVEMTQPVIPSVSRGICIIGFGRSPPSILAKPILHVPQAHFMRLVALHLCEAQTSL